MRPPCPSPLENLTAFAIAFLSGALSALGMSHYVRRVRRGASDAEQH